MDVELMECQHRFKKQRRKEIDGYIFDCTLSDVHAFCKSEYMKDEYIEMALMSACNKYCHVKRKCPHCDKVLPD